MGIYIPGMEMSKNHQHMILMSNGDITDLDGKTIAKAIELPPHGRLGDLDALTHTIESVDWYHQNEEKDMVHGANSFLHQAWYKEQDIYEAIENAETIIPAEPVRMSNYIKLIPDPETGLIFGRFIPAKRNADGAIGLYDVYGENFHPIPGATAEKEDE